MRQMTTMRGTVIWQFEGKEYAKTLLKAEHNHTFMGPHSENSGTEYNQQRLTRELRRFLSMFNDWTWDDINELFYLLHPEYRVMIGTKFYVKREMSNA